MDSSFSVVIPLYNEEDNVRPLHEKLIEALDGQGRTFEIVYVNDGSTDGTERQLTAIAQEDRRARVIHLRRNYGQTAAMMAGIDFASLDVIVPMDGDLQNDPSDIPRMLQKLEEGYDVVSGWRKNRQDPFLTRILPSMAANKLISKISGVHLKDYGCSLKAYRREVLKGVRLYGEMHRFIPIYAKWQGGRVTELPVGHLPRRYGKSKYGISRTFKVLLDLMLISFMDRFMTKPIYVFGGFGILSILLSFLSGLLAIYLKIFHNVSFILTPLPLLFIMTFITGVMGILMGFIAEILMRTYHESQQMKIYTVKSTLNLD